MSSRSFFGAQELNRLVADIFELVLLVRPNEYDVSKANLFDYLAVDEARWDPGVDAITVTMDGSC